MLWGSNRGNSDLPMLVKFFARHGTLVTSFLTSFLHHQSNPRAPFWNGPSKWILISKGHLTCAPHHVAGLWAEFIFFRLVKTVTDMRQLIIEITLNKLCLFDAVDQARTTLLNPIAFWTLQSAQFESQDFSLRKGEFSAN